MSGLKVAQNAGGEWLADFDYFFTGEPRFVWFGIDLITPVGSVLPVSTAVALPPPKRGKHHETITIEHPGGTVESTSQVVVSMRTTSNRLVVNDRVDRTIEWPPWMTWWRARQLARNSPEVNLKNASALIDSGQQTELVFAKAILEGMISQNAQFVPAYVELARIALKENWGPEGLHQAENLLDSALQIEPDSADAKILLGYVAAHQKRFPKAQALFADATAAKTDNLWLWYNWGEMLAMQGKFDQAIEMYRKAIAGPVTRDHNDRARAPSYAQMLVLLKERKDFDGMELLYKQRIVELGPGSCYSTDYARFMLEQRGDTQSAINLARGALNLNCEDSPARQVLGLAEYVKWAHASDAERTEALNQARIFLPMSALTLYLLATNERTITAAKAQIAAGEQIDQKDNGGMTALAYALKKQDLRAAKRLLDLGASATTPVGFEGIPIALVCVMDGDIEAIRLLQRSGANFGKLRYRGASAFDIARASGNSAVVEALEHNEL